MQYFLKYTPNWGLNFKNRWTAKSLRSKLKTLDTQTHLQGNSEYVTLG